MQKVKNFKDNYLLDISNKLNLKTYNYLFCSCYSQGEHIFPEILNSVIAVVLNENCYASESKLKKNEKMKNIKFIKDIFSLDDSAFDRVIYFYNKHFVNCLDDMRNIIKKLINIVDNNGFVLMLDTPKSLFDEFNFETLDEMLNNNGIFEIWKLKSKDQNNYDLLFKVKKYEKV